jgi:excisionase family DNA binding protein
MANTIQTKEVLSRKEAAEYIGVSRSTLDRLGITKIQVRRRVFYKKENIDRWLAQNTKEGNPA